jgi:twitching motility two-component system response regulator PilG
VGSEMCIRDRLSAKDAEIDRNLGIHAGANDYVTKPFKDVDLVSVVDKYLKMAASAD